METPKKRRPLSPKLAGQLEKALCELIALSMLSKQAYWNISEPALGPLHAYYEQLTDALRVWYDLLARQMMLEGLAVDGRPATVARKARQTEFPEGSNADSVELMFGNLEETALQFRGLLSDLGNEDPSTRDLVTGIVEGLEKQAWSLRANVK